MGGIAISGLLVSNLYGPDYSPAALPLQIMLIGSMFGALGIPGSALLLALEKADLKSIFLLPVAALNLALAYSFVPSYGALGAALANVVCQLLVVAIDTTYLIRQQQFRLPFAFLFRIILSAILSAVIAYLVAGWLSGWTGLIAAVLLGAGSYVFCITVSGTLASSDFELLKGMGDLFPRRINTLIRRIVGYLESASMSSTLLFKQNRPE
jgi:O-antigen/teichoic acid export membrane protein